jgi:hypothetical protein
MLHSQTSAAPSLPKKLIRISTPMLNVVDNDSSVLVLKMEFNGAIPKSRLASVKIRDIESISLAYSRFRLSDMFDQMTLNAQRMDKLYALMPGLKDNKSIQWYWVEQTGCDNPDACNEYFHGFVIRLKSETLMLERKTEEQLMDYYMTVYEGGGDTEKMDSLMRDKKMKLIKSCDTIHMRTLKSGNRIARIRGWDKGKNDKLARLLKEELKDSGIFHLEVRMDKNGHLASIENSGELTRSAKITKLLNDNLSVIPARYMNKKIETQVSVTIELFNGTADVQLMQTPVLPNNEVFVLDKFLYHESSKIVCDYKDTSIKGGYKPSLSSTPDIIFRVFDRNRQWKNCLIATDVTGSMYPYLAQFKVWHKINLSSNSGNHDFVFFNDGNNMPDFMKVTGHVGGVYYVKTFQFDSLSRYMSMSMNRGGGGDGPENNIEAVITGLKQNPHCKEVIMIADNWATPRDLSLLSKVNVPIRLILCGAQTGINTAYLDMIRKNKGSIHTMEQDLYDLSRFGEGQTIELDGVKYMLKNGKFTVVPVSLTAR